MGGLGSYREALVTPRTGFADAERGLGLRNVALARPLLEIGNAQGSRPSGRTTQARVGPARGHERGLTSRDRARARSRALAIGKDRKRGLGLARRARAGFAGISSR